ncbi:hypothetical protein GDO78_017116 [Eleutherodactylus coqui]|uniref:TIL domain-containing protein n=2 Tax=Eleutherodactylus coqui TaxID=57060 RepID=A0A8J6B8V3_ELECQ|nr:hypothetical protein GDO78_017116 [Eleutherodactylus coqui]
MRPVSVLLLSLLSAAVILISAYRVPPTKSCGPNQVYEQCRRCQTYCNDTQKMVCERKCRPGCYCEKGYLQLHGTCIKKAECEACTGNWTYSLCAHPCPSPIPRTCSNMNETLLINCLAMCGPGCLCKPGYVRDKGRCILPQDCPKI